MNISSITKYLLISCILATSAASATQESKQANEMDQYRAMISKVIISQGQVLLPKIRERMLEKLQLPFAVGGMTHMNGDSQANLGWELLTKGKPFIRAVLEFSPETTGDGEGQWVTVEVVVRDDAKEDIIPKLTVKVAPRGRPITEGAGKAWNSATEKFKQDFGPNPPTTTSANK